MMRYAILLIAISLLSLKGYSQDTGIPSSKEINKYLAEGLECKKLLPILQEQVNVLDSLNLTNQARIANLQEQAALNRENTEMEHERFMRAADDLGKYKAEAEKQEKRKRFWRTMSVVEGVVLVGAGLLIAL